MKDSKNSSPVLSSQSGVHPDLRQRVERNAKHLWRPIIPSHTRDAFDIAKTLADGFEGNLIFDSGCGTGMSTRRISQAYPDSLVIGIDKSASRLSRAWEGALPKRQGNIIWVRAELAAFWHLALNDGWALHKHYQLYPNPWPKPGHLKRRWHGHPVFPTLLGLGGHIELRTNWKIYADEFAEAITQVSGFATSAQIATADPVTTLFEQKYLSSGHHLYSVVTADLTGVINSQKRAFPAA